MSPPKNSGRTIQFMVPDFPFLLRDEVASAQMIEELMRGRRMSRTEFVVEALTAAVKETAERFVEYTKDMKL